MNDGRIQIEGEDPRVDDRGATPLALVIHELATNAAKYGALSSAEGEVTVRVAAGPDELSIEWDEQGGPPIDGEPQRIGFGSTLMHLSVVSQLGGRFDRQWRRDGLLARIVVPESAMARGGD